VQLLTGKRSKGKRPLLYSCESMRRPNLAIMSICKPRKRNRNATPNRLTGNKLALAAQKKNLPLTCGLPSRNMRTLQLDCRPGRRRTYIGPNKAIVFIEEKNTRNTKIVVELDEIHIDSQCR
jgi:hypothetical protein